MKTSFSAPFYISILIVGLLSVQGYSQAATSRIVPVWGYDLTMRLDTLTGQTTDSLRYNRSTFKIVTDSTYSCSYYPAECKGILVFTDADGNVQNFAVKQYEFEFFNGNIMRGGYSNRRELWEAARAIERHKIGDYVTITKVQLVDLNGKPINAKVPPFKIVKTR